MAFLDKIGQVANKVGEVAGDTFDYGKAKGKIVLERGKVKDAKEALGDYVYQAMKEGKTPDENTLKTHFDEIEGHLAEIERLEAEARKAGEDIKE